MPENPAALGGSATHLFGGIPVSNFQAALEWYTRLFGVPPAFFPNDREAVWALAEHRWLYIIVDEARAGGAIQTVMCANLDAVLTAIAARGLTFTDQERPGPGTRKVMFHDPDGNEIGLGSVPAG
ncbi:MAG TPA: VOC family protein [Devosia sp.]|jgi:catechol 2,3-dioxygenase-like lactoylglutathione lyase family enzyme|nr:VOC family protein [Devosia sp.]